MDWRKWGRWALVALVTLAIFLTFLPEWQADKWWVRQWDYPRLQVAGVLLIGILALLWVDLRRSRGFWILIGGAAAALAWQLTHFIAFTLVYPKEVQSAENCPAGQSLSLLNINVLMTNDDYQAVLDVAEREDADVLLLLETGTEWEKAMAPLSRQYPQSKVDAVPNTYGMMLFSKLPMKAEILYRIQPAVPSAKAMVELRNGQQVILHALHPEPPWPGDDSGERDAELVSAGREVREDGRAAVVLGDMNDVAWSNTTKIFKRVSGTGDPRVGRGFYPTFTAKYPLLRWPLDHLFVTPHFKVERIAVLDYVGSDHFPIRYDLCLTQPADRRLIARNPDRETQEEASQELQQGIEEQAEEGRDAED